MKKFVVVWMALILSASVFSQRSTNNDYWNTYRYTPKEGMVDDFEKAVAKKMAIFNNTPETAMLTYKIITGPNAGTYERVESDKYPKDYDLDRTNEMDYWNENVGKYVAKTGGQVRWDRMNNASLNFDPEKGTPSKYIQRTTFSVKADQILAFRRYFARMTKVAEKRGWKGVRLLFRIVSGGNRNEFVAVSGFDTHVRPESPKQENTWEEDYNELFGWGSLDEDVRKFDESIEIYGEFRETMILVPELSTGSMK